MIDAIRSKRAFICDMDGVVYHGGEILPGVLEFVAWLQAEGKRFLFLTNSSGRTPKEHSRRLARMGIEVGAEHFYTSALATAMFLSQQRPGGSAYVIGDTGLTNALYQADYAMDDVSPDYVVVGESRTYNYDTVVKAVHLVQGGARLIGCCPDLCDPSPEGVIPATGALIAPIELATGRKAYFVGKPNPLMMRHALKVLGCRREDAVVIGDRMDTDIVAGLEAEIETVLVLSGVTSRADLGRFAFAPNHVMDGIGDLVGP